MTCNERFETMEPNVRSPFSGSESSTIWGLRDGQFIYSCPDTGAVFFDRQVITRESYENYYHYLDRFDAQRNTWELGIRRSKYKKQLRLMERFAPGRELLDIGAGPGYLCRIAQENGWSATGVEICDRAVQHGRANFDTQYASFDDIEASSIDAITCHHVLEHLELPIEFLITVNMKLKKHGLLVVHVPHQQPFTLILRNFIRKTARSGCDTCCSLYENIHISGFTTISLSKVVERAGFKTHFVRSAGMWTKYYDPFFVMNYVRSHAWGSLTKHAIRHAVESIGTPFGCGDWVIGYFQKL